MIIIIIVTIIRRTRNGNSKQTNNCSNKMMFNKHWSDVTMASQIKPTG